MGRPELAQKRMTIRYDGVPTTTTELAANRYPPADNSPFNIKFVSTAKWSEIFNTKATP